MNKLEKAKDFYLRGFRSTYIKRRTGILAGEFKKQFPELDKPAIMKYQIVYLSSRYSMDEIAIELEKALSVSNVEGQIKTKSMIILGCAFGPYDKVFIELLGKKQFLEIQKRCKIIRENSASITGRDARTQTMIARYGSEGPNGNSEIAARMIATTKATNIERYGVENVMQVPDKAAASAIHRQKTMIQKYGAGNSVQIPEVREKILESRKRNGTLTTSKHESVLYDLLVQQFGIDDIERNYKDDRYPSYVDFYIRSRDLFIELNADKSHNDHWYDESNKDDIDRIKWMQKRAIEIDKEIKFRGKKHKSRYWNYIRVWSITDVEKRTAARKHNLNYLVFWDSAIRVIDGIKQPRLKDVHKWIDARCPDSKNWKKENTW